MDDIDFDGGHLYNNTLYVEQESKDFVIMDHPVGNGFNVSIRNLNGFFNSSDY